MAIDASAAESKPPSGFMQSRAFTAVRVAVTLAIVGGLIYRLSPGELSDVFTDSDPLLMLAAVALMIVVQALVVVKWMVLMRARDVVLPLPRALRCYCLGSLLNNVLPTAVGGDVYRIYRVQRETTARAADVAMTVLYERATGYAAMTCLGCLGAAFYYGHALWGLLALAGGGVAAVLLLYVVPRAPFPAMPMDHFLRNLLAHRREGLAVYRMTVFSLVIQALYISTIVLAGRALGIDVSWWYWAFATWLVALALLVPATLGGLGVREGGYSALIDSAGGTAAQGASAGFALGLLLIVSNLIGLALVEGYDRYFAHDAPLDESEIADAERALSTPARTR